MINYDELHRTLTHEFYEIDPQKEKIKYGDLIIFLQVPKNDEKNMIKLHQLQMD